MKIALILVIIFIICSIIVLMLNIKKDKEKKNHIKNRIFENNIINLYDFKEQKYIGSTTNSKIIDDLNKITNIVLKNINDNNKTNYHKLNYGDIIIRKDNNHNKQYIFDIFVHEKINNFNRKLRIDLIKYVNDSNYKTKEDNRLRLSPDFDDNKHDSLILSPMDVIVTNRDFFKKVELNENNDIKFIHINHIDIENTELKSELLKSVNTTNLFDIKIENSNKVVGLHKTNNDYNNINSKIIFKGSEKSVNRNKWPTINNKQHLSSLFKNVQNNWDEWGIYNNDNNIKKYIQSKVSNNPTVNKKLSKNGPYDNLFDMDNQTGVGINNYTF